jgi:citronellol/citronellal dehydrogenase
MMNKPIALITGSTRGIGKAIAIKLASEGYTVIITGKTKETHDKLPGTLDSVVEEIRALGFDAESFQVDVRDDQQLESLFRFITEKYGYLDVLVNNASAISLTQAEATSMKKFDLMLQVNGRATFACSKMSIPLLQHSKNPHILTMSPPLNLNPKWFKKHTAYTLSKYMMSLCVLGLSAELKDKKIAVNALWPKTIIATAAIEFNFPKEMLQRARNPQIVADAAWAILSQPSVQATGQFFIDQDVIEKQGVTDFSRYAVNPDAPLIPDLYLD